MLYRNKNTGHVIETFGQIVSPDYEEVKVKKPAQTRAASTERKTAGKEK